MHTVDNYYHLVRHSVVKYVSNYMRRLLDIGCGARCAVSDLNWVRGLETVIGVEYVQQVAAEAALCLDCVHTSDIEQIELSYPHGRFDCILSADVLEHLCDPWNVPRRLRCCSYVGWCANRLYPGHSSRKGAYQDRV